MKIKRAVLKELAHKYQSSSKKAKGQVFEEFIGLTGYNRCYGSWLFGNGKLKCRGNDKQKCNGRGKQKSYRDGK
ncbi:MAG: hypothetical protein PHQ25_07530 [Acidobacteriota bacterium]|nr:hypothetical protein [Acidobacteriota bacterium]MDW3228298.1 hypothetical protein [Acidobacteriota bacterium]MDY0232194.1 hypothetical protein [Candidatus Saccharicenans sp.]